jgi:hypothetical protein
MMPVIYGNTKRFNSSRWTAPCGFGRWLVYGRSAQAQGSTRGWSTSVVTFLAWAHHAFSVEFDEHKQLKLVTRGWNKNSLPEHTQIVCDGYQSKDGGLRLKGLDLMFPDGKKLSAGSPGTGAPEERPEK